MYLKSLPILIVESLDPLGHIQELTFHQVSLWLGFFHVIEDLIGNYK
jgi:hypothetical protein